jgi:hypothetical protein
MEYSDKSSDAAVDDIDNLLSNANHNFKIGKVKDVHGEADYDEIVQI